jgi:large subunit ribosomal protein L6
MTLTSGANCLRQALNITHGAVSVPLFLVPALQRPSRSFSSSPSCSSKLSRTPVTVPPEVSITVIPPIVSKRRNTLVVQRDVSMSTVEIKGPLGTRRNYIREDFANEQTGTMAMKIPPYVSINRQKADGPVTLAVEDSTIKEQRAMWGQ